MSYPQAIFLVIIQGLTEFLPISSSGHLVIFQKLFNLEPPVLFDVLVHVGTLGSVIFFFRKKLVQIVKGLAQKNREAWKIFWLLVIGTMPAVIVGFFSEPYLNQIFDSFNLVGFTLIVTAGLLFLSKSFTSTKRRFNQIKWLDALWVGVFQALAILPGISRSGSTVVSGLWRKFDRETAFRFSFYLAIPAILGALVLQLPELLYSTCTYFYQGIVGMFIAGIVGYGALVILKKILVSNKLWIFGIYCLFLSGLIFLSNLLY